MRIGTRIILIAILSSLFLAASGPAWAQGPDGVVWKKVSTITPEWGPGCYAGSDIYYESTPNPRGRVSGSSESACDTGIWHIGVTGTFQYGSGSWRKSVDRYGYWSGAGVYSPQFTVSKGTYLVQTGNHRFSDPQWGSYAPTTRVTDIYR